jgi:hypothetical protein
MLRGFTTRRSSGLLSWQKVDRRKTRATVPLKSEELRGNVWQVQEVKRFYLVSKCEGFIWVVTFLATLLLDVDVGILGHSHPERKVSTMRMVCRCCHSLSAFCVLEMSGASTTPHLHPSPLSSQWGGEEVVYSCVYIYIYSLVYNLVRPRTMTVPFILDDVWSMGHISLFLYTLTINQTSGNE